MSTSVKPIPDGYSAVTPYLTLKNAAEAIEFYKKAFGAVERMKMATPDGKVMHAEITIGNAVIMMGGECSESGFTASPSKAGVASITLYVYVENVDAVVAQAAMAGAQVLRSPEDQFYGDRSATVRDPEGHIWNIATHVEDVSEAEIHKRAARFMQQPVGASR